MKHLHELLGLNKNPFGSTPDPDMFYKSSEHEEALLRLIMSIDEHRGLSLILGDVGLGKTTICRALITALANDNKYIFHLILNPKYRTEFAFLCDLAKSLNLKPHIKSTIEYRETIRQFLYKTCVEEKKVFILLVDEAQQLSFGCLEVLRNFLNYETNEAKLLQLVLFSQIEILQKLKRQKNFVDRIMLKYALNPLTKQDTKNMIKFRLLQAGSGDRTFFTDEALETIFTKTEGYPRKITSLCYEALQTILFLKKEIVDTEIIEFITKEDLFHDRTKKRNHTLEPAPVN